MPVGGAEVLVQRMVGSLPGVEVRCLCLRELGAIGEEIQQGDPARIELLPVAKGKRLNLCGVWKVSRWLRANGIGVVHTHVYNAHVYGVLAARLARIPSIVHHHKSWATMRRHRFLMMWLLSRFCARSITLSKETREDIAKQFGVDEESIEVLSNPVERVERVEGGSRAERRRELGLPEEEFCIATVASLTPPKNPMLNIQMFGALRERVGDRVKFCWFGEGRLRGEMEAAIGEGGLVDSFKLMGIVRPVLPWLGLMDLFVLCSSWEGQSIALMQALGSGVPVIASDIEGNRAILGPDFPGLFPAGDREAYVEMVERAVNREEFRRELTGAQEALLGSLPSEESYHRKLAGIYGDLF